MNISEYRREFAAFNTSIELARYRHHAGLDSRLKTGKIFDRYSHLFTTEAIADLSLLHDQASSDLETERTAILQLLKAARFWHIESTARNLNEELNLCESSSRLVWDGNSLSIREVAEALAKERASARRRELSMRLVDAVSACDDLRSERVELLQQSARESGLASYKDLFAPDNSAECKKILQDADFLLERTQSAYTSALADAVTRYLDGLALPDLYWTDYLFLQQMSGLQRFFPSCGLLSAYTETISGLGIQSHKQSNLTIDGEVRAGKKAGAALFRVDPPEDVRVVFTPADGPPAYRDLWHAAGKAQHHAWCSAELARRYPEFIYAIDCATTEGYGFLFSYLLIDAKWLMEHLSNVSKSKARAIARDLAFLVLHDVRRWCARVNHACLQSLEDVRSGQLHLSCAEIIREATGFSCNPALLLADADLAFRSVSVLRAVGFAFTLTEFLRTRYGNRWWVSHKAGEELRDLWNTGSRYSVEEIARLAGGCEISLDFVGDSLLAVIKGA